MKLEDVVPHHQAEIRELLNQVNQYSVFEDYKDFQLFVARRMQVQVNQQSLGFSWEAFILLPHSVYHYNRFSKHFDVFKGGYAELRETIENYYIKNQEIIQGYAGEIERLEDFLFDREIPPFFTDFWFDIKKDLSRIENFYYRNMIVFREFLKKTEPQIKPFFDDYKDIEEGIQFQISSVATLKGRLESLHHYNESIKQERLNKTLLTLTVISGIFLPLNLIVGFFGMNTDGLYFHGDIEGTNKVLVILAIVVFICLAGFKLIRIVDNYVLRIFLGRYDFYKNILGKAGDLDKSLKGK